MTLHSVSITAGAATPTAMLAVVQNETASALVMADLLGGGGEGWRLPLLEERKSDNRVAAASQLVPTTLADGQPCCGVFSVSGEVYSVGTCWESFSRMLAFLFC